MQPPPDIHRSASTTGVPEANHDVLTTSSYFQECHFGRLRSRVDLEHPTQSIKKLGGRNPKLTGKRYSYVARF